MKNILNINEILLSSIYSLGGSREFLDTEDIAQKAFKISPSKLSWKKYKDQIDLNKVKVNLYSASKKKFVYGNEKKGWMLTDKGIDIIHSSKNKTNNFKLRMTKMDKIEREREISRIEKNIAYLNYVNSKLKPSFRQMQNIFKVDGYTSAENKKKRIRKVINLCKENTKIYKFLERNKKIIMKARI
tara:strand:+ start:283 stop:840 length:558 start_codon:yes stop_codon:yes gene_type:complete